MISSKIFSDDSDGCSTVVSEKGLQWRLFAIPSKSGRESMTGQPKSGLVTDEL
ncbi:MAG: hypothetical protein AB7V04_14330 [Desulfomonilaceae bacterium]